MYIIGVYIYHIIELCIVYEITVNKIIAVVVCIYIYRYMIFVCA